jgi:hypothetical protein
MSPNRLFIFLATVVLAFPCAGRAVNVVINNFNTDYDTSEVYFSFRDAPVTGTINGQPLVQEQSYSLDDIGSGITLQEFIGGRIYFSLGTPLTGTGDPEPVNSTIANYGTRFDKIEVTYSDTTQSGVADLSAIDYFAIPLAMQTYNASADANGDAVYDFSTWLGYWSPGSEIIYNLAALTANNPAVALYDDGGNFLRVLGPALAPAGAYPSFQPYLDAVAASGQTTLISDLYSSAGATPATTTQQYQFTASFDATGNLDLDGGGLSGNGGPSVGSGHEIVIRAADLAPGIYSANPNYTVDGAAANIGNNDVYAAVVRDILTGFALGFVGSPTIDPNTGIAFEDEPSSAWWLSSQAFDFLQSDPAFYDQYAAYLAQVSTAYGYPFSDRWQAVQASLDTTQIDTMEIDVMSDTFDTIVISPIFRMAPLRDRVVVENGGKDTVIFRRTGSLHEPLPVRYEVRGSAVAGVDYKALSGKVTIPAGKLRARVRIKPIDDATTASDTRIIKVKLMASPEKRYTLGSPASVRIKIDHHD